MLCKACDKYLELLNDEEDLHHGQNDRDHDQDGHDVVMMKDKYCKFRDAVRKIKKYRKPLYFFIFCGILNKNIYLA